MKIKSDFVTNSSSTSYLLIADENLKEYFTEEKIKDLVELCKVEYSNDDIEYSDELYDNTQSFISSLINKGGYFSIGEMGTLEESSASDYNVEEIFRSFISYEGWPEKGINIIWQAEGGPGYSITEFTIINSILEKISPKGKQ